MTTISLPPTPVAGSKPRTLCEVISRAAEARRIRARTPTSNARSFPSRARSSWSDNPLPACASNASAMSGWTATTGGVRGAVERLDLQPLRREQRENSHGAASGQRKPLDRAVGVDGLCQRRERGPRRTLQPDDDLAREVDSCRVVVTELRRADAVSDEDERRIDLDLGAVGIRPRQVVLEWTERRTAAEGQRRSVRVRPQLAEADLLQPPLALARRTEPQRLELRGDVPLGDRVAALARAAALQQVV